MIIGDKSRFAIEVRLKQPVGKWLFGNVRFLVGELPVGNFDEVVTLKATANTFSNLLPRTSVREADVLVHLSATELIHYAWRGFTGEFDEGSQLTERYVEANNYVIAPNGDVAFDGWLVLLVQGYTYDRLIWCNKAFHNAEELSIVTCSPHNPEEALYYGEVTVGKGECGYVLDDFTKWIDTRQ